jgi:hypothetical protein
MKAKQKKPQGFFNFNKSHFAAGIAGLIIGIAGAQLHPAITQASASVLQPSPSPKAHATVMLKGAHPAVPAKVSPLQAAEPTPSPAPAPAKAAEPAPAAAPAAPAVPTTPGLTGSIGYALAYGNCVNEPGVNNPHYGNPISWPVLSSEPTIGATALFTWNHTGVVTGLWSNGDVEVRHQNYWGGTHRFPRSMFRGFR